MKIYAPSVRRARPGGRRLFELARAAAQHPAAAGAMQVAVLGERVFVIAPTAALRLELLVSADEAERVAFLVGPKAAADCAALGEWHAQRRWRSQILGSTAGPPCRISKCKCGPSSGSETPTVPSG